MYSYNPASHDLRFSKLGSDLDNWIFCEDSRKTVWVSPYFYGLFELTAGQTGFVYHYNYAGNPTSGPETAFDITQDASGNLWIASSDGNMGLLKLSLRALQFQSYTPKSDRARLSEETQALAISDSSLLIGDGTTLVRYDHSLPPRSWQMPRGLSSPNDFFNVQECENGKIWIGVAGAGLCELDINTSILSFFTGYRGFGSNNRIGTLCQDKAGILWVGTYLSGLHKFDLRTRKFLQSYIHDSSDPSSLSGRVFSVHVSRDGTLWAGTLSNGLNRFDANTETFFNWQHDPKDSTSISSNWVMNAFEDRDGNIWVVTSQGVNRLDRRTGKFTQFFRGDGTTPEAAFHIVQDNNGDMWVSYFEGLSKLDPKTGKFMTYTTKDGLPSNQLNTFARPFVRPNGEVVMPNAAAITVFHPDSIRPSAFIPNIVLTSFTVFEKSIPLSEDSFGYKTVTIPYDSNFFSFGFAALDLTVPERNQHAYKLEGYEDNWNFVGNEREAHYTKVPPGEYVFRVKGSNSDGVWNGKGTFITIIITPPWWKTMWAYVGYLVLAGVLFYSGRRYDLKRVQMKHELEIKQMKEKALLNMMAHDMEVNDLKEKKMLEMDEMKNRFFANISHEFRTPLTLILGPIQKWRGRMGDGEMGSDLGMMERNANRLLHLVNQLLDLSKLEAGGMKLQASKQNVVPFVKGIAQSFESSAGRRHVTLSVEAESDEFEVYFDRDKLEKVLVNLLSNAFKFTAEGGEVRITVGRRASSPNSVEGSGPPTLSLLRAGTPLYISISVKDTGIGIPADQLDKVFVRFYQVDASQTREQEGSGIGLALTKELVELHRGSISVKSEVGMGTEFIVALPLGKEHLTSEEIITEETPRLKISPSRVDGPIPISEPRVVNLEPLEIASSLESVPRNDTLPLVLIIEDNADVRAYIRSYLDSHYRMLDAVDGADGVEQAKYNIPDLIISDVMMPRMDGNEVVRQLKHDEKTSHIPIILLTAKAGQENKLEGLGTGADDYLTKPFDANELLVRMKNLIELRRKLREKFSVSHILKPGEIAVTSIDDQFLQKSMAIVEKKMSDEKFSVEEFAEEVGMSRSQLHRKLTALTNQSPSDFTRYMRLHRAKELIEKNAGTISEIAFQVGFNSVAYFTKCFREQFGVVPSQVTKNRG
jgi:signal transduction histidine kinase/DNA-binding response OmpR family regulator/ligand-binding sensor domain-containing protein